MEAFLSACGLGLAFFAMPGAVTAQLLRRGLARGFFSALSLQLGGLLGVTLWAIIAFIGAAFLAHNVPVRTILGGVGIVLLSLLAWQALRAAYHGKLAEAKAAHVRGDFTLGVVMSLASPMPVAFWLGIGSTLVESSGNRAPSPPSVALFLAGFVASGLVWCALMSGLIAWGRQFITPLFFRLVNLICGLALAFFALKLLLVTLLLLRG